MSALTIDAVYENGQFRPKQAVELADGTEVRLTIGLPEEIRDPLEGVIGIGDGPPEGDGAANHDQYIYGKLHP